MRRVFAANLVQGITRCRIAPIPVGYRASLSPNCVGPASQCFEEIICTTPGRARRQSHTQTRLTAGILARRNRQSRDWLGFGYLAARTCIMTTHDKNTLISQIRRSETLQFCCWHHSTHWSAPEPLVLISCISLFTPALAENRRSIVGPSRRCTVPGQHGYQLLITGENLLMVRDLKNDNLTFHPMFISRPSWPRGFQHLIGSGAASG